MRKYFLLGVAALMTATSVNAEVTDFAYIDVKANIDRAVNYTCSPLNFGNIVIPQGEEGWVSVYEYDGDYKSSNIISFTGDSEAKCDGGELNDPDEGALDISGWSVPSKINVYLWGADDMGSLEVELTHSNFGIGGKLNITAEASAGEYSNSFLITKVTE